MPQWLKVAIPAAILLLLALWVRWIIKSEPQQGPAQSEPQQTTMTAASFYGLSKQQMIERLGPPLSTNRVGDNEEGFVLIYGYEDGTLFTFEEGKDQITDGIFKGTHFNKAGALPPKRQ